MTELGDCPAISHDQELESLKVKDLQIPKEQYVGT